MTRLFDPQQMPKIIDLLPPEALSHLGVASPVPVLDLPLADGRKWCVAALRRLAGGAAPQACPTDDLKAEGVCRRSPCGGRCLLLLPGDHPDWRAARRYRYDEARAVVCLREEPAPSGQRPPLGPEQMQGRHPAQAVLAALARLEWQVDAELEDLRQAGYPITVDARSVVQAELAGRTIDLETGE